MLRPNHVAFVVLAGFLASTTAYAFEHDGLSSGMKESDALSVFSSFGSYQKHPIQGFPDSSIFITNGSSSTRAFQTCKSRLVTYQRDLPGGWHAFMRTLQREENLLGRGKYSWGTGETEMGPHDSISIVWQLPNQETYEISFGQTGESRPYAYQLFKTANSCGL